MLSLLKFQEKLKQTVKGQDNAVKVVTTCIYKYLLKLHARDKGLFFTGGTNVLLHGQSGAGKTFIVKKAAEVFEIPIFEINAKSICQEGWSGKSFMTLLNDCFYEYTSATNKTPTGGIIFIDEIDKILGFNSSTTGDANFHIQVGLLKYIEGMETTSKSKQIDFNNYMFVFAGAFSDMEKQHAKKPDIGFSSEPEEETKEEFLKEIIKYGMLPEFAGRIQEYCRLNNITEEIYTDILENNKDFCSVYWKELLECLDIDLKPNNKILIEKANASNLGVRGLIQAVEDLITQTIHDNIDKVDLEKFSPLYSRKEDIDKRMNGGYHDMSIPPGDDGDL